MRVSNLFLSALVAFGALAAPLVSAASSSPAQSKIDSLKSLIESSAGGSSGPLPALPSCTQSAVSPAAPGPARPGVPSSADYCDACQSLLNAGPSRSASTCGTISKAHEKEACHKIVYPYLAECNNKAVMDAFDAANKAKPGAMQAKQACSQMINGAPAALMIAKHGMNGWPLAARHFCPEASLMEVATETRVKPAAVCAAPPTASAAPAPSAPTAPVQSDLCAACQALLNAGLSRSVATCATLTTAKAKDACQQEVQPYFTDCDNAALITAFDAANAAKAGAMQAQTTCKQMKNGFPANAVSGWPPAYGNFFC